MAQLMTPIEVADALGIEESTLHEWRQRGLAPRSLRIGAEAVRFVDDDVTAWVMDQTRSDDPVLDVEVIDSRQQVLPMGWRE